MSENITEYRNENTKNIDLLSTIDIVRKINEEDKLVALAIEDELPNEDNYDEGVKDAQCLTDNDVCVVISASGNPKYLLGVLNQADKVNCRTIALTCNHDAMILEEAGLGICVEVGPEVIAGSSRMKAGSVQKMVLNMLSTGAMIKIGKTYENFMIDLMPTNEKHKDRAIRIVAEIAGVNHSKALQTLLECDWSVKTSIMMLKCNLTREQAEDTLRRNCGVLRRALNSFSKL